MPFVPVADTVLAEIRMELYGQRIENTLGFRLLGGSGTAEATALANDLTIWWAELYSVPLSNELSLREVTITDLASESGYSVSVTAPTPAPTGDVNAPGLPGNVAACISFRTVSRGRSFRGRNYVPGIAEASVSGNTLDATVRAGILAAYNGLAAAVVSDDWEHVVISRFTDGAPRVAGVATPVTSYVFADNFVDSQRRRLTGRGN
jgi:hypothetical protein